MAGGRVLVTGSSRGIGLEFVRQYAADGYDVIATCRDPETADDLGAIGKGIRVRRLDVTSEQQLDELAIELDGEPIDILICNAAIFGGPRARFPEVDPSSWREALDVNVVGGIRVALRLWRNVAASGERKIAIISSRAGLPREARPGMSYVYASSKAALNAAGRCLALDLAPEGVIVALLNPGHVSTGIGGANAPMTTTDSVSKLRRVIRELSPSEAGKFLHFDGSELAL